MKESPSVPNFPKMREDITFTPQVMRGKETFIVKDPVRRKFMQFDHFGKYFCELCDGNRSIKDISDRLRADYPEEDLDEEYVSDYLKHLVKLKLVLKDRFEFNILLMERVRQDRDRNNSILHLKFPAFNPDPLLQWLLGKIRWMLSKPFKLFYYSFVVGSFVIIAANFSEVLNGLLTFYKFDGWTALHILLLYITIVLIIVCHEFGHGLTCKYFGGEVPAMGFLIIYLINPALYCNVSDSYRFPRKMERLWVVYGGVVVELFIGALAVYVWWLTDPTLLIHNFAFKIVVFSSITSILFNMNPLLKYDGYYALAEIVEIPNLRKHSFAYLGYLIRQRLGLPGNKPPGSTYEHRIYFIFGVCAFLYAAMIFSIIFSLLRNLLVVKLALAGLGWIFLSFLMYILLRKVLKKSTGFLKLAMMDHSGMIRRNLPIFITIFVLLLVVPAAIRVPTVIKGIATLEPYAYSDLTASAPGYVVEMLVNTGDLVEKDQVVAVMQSDSLEIALTVLMGKQNRLRTLAGNAVMLGEIEIADRYYSQLSRLDEEESMLLMRRKGLEVRSPRSGVVLTERVKDRQFQFLSEGSLLMRIGMVDSLRVRLEASERQLSDLHTGTPAKFKPESDPWSIARGRIVAIDIVGDRRPEEIESVYRVEAVVMNTDLKLFPGQSGQIRLYGKRRSLWASLLRKAIQTLRLDFFI